MAGLCGDPGAHGVRGQAWEEVSTSQRPEGGRGPCVTIRPAKEGLGGRWVRGEVLHETFSLFCRARTLMVKSENNHFLFLRQRVTPFKEFLLTVPSGTRSEVPFVLPV